MGFYSTFEDIGPVESRIDYLENNEYKLTYWQSISANSGTITKPTNSTIILDSFMEGVDALVETIVNGQPSGQSPVTSGGSYVTVSSFDSNGNYILSGTPSSFDVALLYIIKIDAKYYQNVNNDFVITSEPVKEVVQTILEGDLNHSPSSNAIFDSIQNYNILYVENNPRPGGFATIDDALVTITTSSPTNYFKIQIGVGEFVKGSQEIPSYVSILGASIQTTKIIPDGNNHVFELVNPYIELSYFTIANAPSGKAGIFNNDSGDFNQVHKLSFIDCDINIYTKSITRDTVFYGEYIDYNGIYSIGTKVEATNGFRSFSNLENYYNLPTGGSPVGTYTTGVGSYVHILASGQISYGSGIAIYLENGAVMQLTSTEIDSWDVGIKSGNVGSFTNITSSGVTCLNSTSWDLYLEDPLVIGTIQGAFDINKVTSDGIIPGATPITLGLLLQGTIDNSITLNGEIKDVFGENITDISALIVKGGGMGILSGGYLSDGGGLDLDIAGGLGYLTNTAGELIKYSWATQAFAIPDDSQGYVYFNENLILSFSGSAPDLTNSIYLGYVGTRSGVFEFISSTGMQGKNVSNKYATLFIKGFGAVYSSGSIISENTTPFHLDITGGVYYISSNHLQPVGGTNITFKQYYNTGGVLTPLTTNYYAKHSVYLVGGDDVVGNEQYFVVLAQAEYSTLLAAQEALLPLPPSYFTGNIVLIGSIIIKEGDANIVQIIDNRPILGNTPQGVNASADHTSLLNLTTGDAGHSQFMLLTGSTPMTGNLNIGGNDISNVNLVDGVDVSAHAARHDFNGADPLLTGVPSTIGSANAEGVSNARVARLDHVHAHGDQAGGSTHSAVTTSVNGFMIAADKVKIDAAELTTNKNTPNGYPSLSSLYQLQLINQAGTIINLLTNTTTSGRIWTLPNATGTIALTSDIPTFPLTTKGDLLTRDATSNVRLPVGANDYLVYADSTLANGLGWKEAGSVKYNFSNIVRFTGIISPAQILANQNDYSPTGLSTANVLRLDAPANRDITGFAAQENGRQIVIFNVGAGNIKLKNENAGSVAANRFAIAADATLAANESATIWYDITSARWRLISKF